MLFSELTTFSHMQVENGSPTGSVAATSAVVRFPALLALRPLTDSTCVQNTATLASASSGASSGASSSGTKSGSASSSAASASQTKDSSASVARVGSSLLVVGGLAALFL